LEINFLAIKHAEQSDLDQLFLLTKESWSKSALNDFYDRKQALSKFSISAVILGESVLNVIRRELRRASPDVKIDVEQIRSVLEEEVLKREVVEGEKCEEARKRISRANNRGSKSKIEKVSDVQTPIQTEQKPEPLIAAKPQPISPTNLQ
jgi:hypothetical protein